MSILYDFGTVVRDVLGYVLKWMTVGNTGRLTALVDRKCGRVGRGRRGVRGREECKNWESWGARSGGPPTNGAPASRRQNGRQAMAAACARLFMVETGRKPAGWIDISHNQTRRPCADAALSHPPFPPLANWRLCVENASGKPPIYYAGNPSPRLPEYTSFSEDFPTCEHRLNASQPARMFLTPKRDSEPAFYPSSCTIEISKFFI